MIAFPVGVRVWLAARPADMRKGFDGLAAIVQERLREDPFSGHVFVFRGKRGDLLKILAWDGQGLLPVARRSSSNTPASSPTESCCPTSPI